MNGPLLHRWGLARLTALVAAGVLIPAIVTLAPPAEAESGAVGDLQLTVPVTDITDSDTSLARTTNEVVAVVTGQDGLEVRKFRAASASDATRLVADLNAQPGVLASINRAAGIPAAPTDAYQPKTTGAESAPEAPPAPTISSAHSASATLSGEPLGSDQWGLTAVNAEDAWAVTRGAGVVVAVVDTGVDAEHPDLAGRVLPALSELPDPSAGDPNGHGTHVAGIIGAALDGAGVAGLANEVSILPVQVLGADGTGDAYTIAAGIVDAVDAGADVINLSFEGGSSDIERAAVEYAVDAGVTVVSAGGNEFEDGNPVTFPAAYDGVIGVSSVDQDGDSSWFSSTGDFIDIAAPGEAILSTVPGGGWDYGTGTSMAGSFVSATAALVRSANPTLDKAQVDDAILGTALDDPFIPGRDDLFGYGYLQADLATFTAAQAPGGITGPVAPTAPSDVHAVPGNGSAAITWSPPRNGGGSQLTGFTVTASPGGRTCTTTGATQCTVTGLTNGTAYTFTVQARNALGGSPASPRSASVTPRTPVSVSAARSGYGNVLAVNINPNRGSASYAYRVQKRASNGSWSTLSGVYTSQGTGETGSITLAAGTYRVYVPAAGAYGSAYSPAVTLTAPTATAALTPDRAKDRLVVNVNPNKGSGYWTFKVQKRNSNGSWSTLSTLYKTEGSGETKTINLPRGTYRVKVYPKYGYLGTTSGTATLTR